MVFALRLAGFHEVIKPAVRSLPMAGLLLSIVLAVISFNSEQVMAEDGSSVAKRLSRAIYRLKECADRLSREDLKRLKERSGLSPLEFTRTERQAHKRRIKSVKGMDQHAAKLLVGSSLEQVVARYRWYCGLCEQVRVGRKKKLTRTASPGVTGDPAGTSGDPCAAQHPCSLRLNAMVKEFRGQLGWSNADWQRKYAQLIKKTSLGARVEEAHRKHDQCRAAKAGGAKIHCCRTGLEICHSHIALINWLRNHPEVLRAQHGPDKRRAARPIRPVPKPKAQKVDGRAAPRPQPMRESPTTTPGFYRGIGAPTVARPQPTARRLAKQSTSREKPTEEMPKTQTSETGKVKEDQPKKDNKVITDRKRLDELGCPEWTKKAECLGQDLRCYEAMDDVTSGGLEGRLKVIPFSQACMPSLADQYWQQYGDNPPPLVKAPSGDTKESVKKPGDDRKPEKPTSARRVQGPEQKKMGPADIARLISQVINTIRHIGQPPTRPRPGRPPLRVAQENGEPTERVPPTSRKPPSWTLRDDKPELQEGTPGTGNTQPPSEQGKAEDSDSGSRHGPSDTVPESNQGPDYPELDVTAVEVGGHGSQDDDANGGCVF